MRLNEDEAGQLTPRLDLISVPRSALLAEPGATMEFAYFPVGCVLSCAKAAGAVSNAMDAEARKMLFFTSTPQDCFLRPRSPNPSVSFRPGIVKRSSAP